MDYDPQDLAINLDSLINSDNLSSSFDNASFENASFEDNLNLLLADAEVAVSNDIVRDKLKSKSAPNEKEDSFPNRTKSNVGSSQNIPENSLGMGKEREKVFSAITDVRGNGKHLQNDLLLFIEKVDHLQSTKSSYNNLSMSNILNASKLSNSPRNLAQQIQLDSISRLSKSLLRDLSQTDLEKERKLVERISSKIETVWPTATLSDIQKRGKVGKKDDPNLSRDLTELKDLVSKSTKRLETTVGSEKSNGKFPDIPSKTSAFSPQNLIKPKPLREKTLNFSQSKSDPKFQASKGSSAKPSLKEPKKKALKYPDLTSDYTDEDELSPKKFDQVKPDSRSPNYYNPKSIAYELPCMIQCSKCGHCQPIYIPKNGFPTYRTNGDFANPIILNTSGTLETSQDRKLSDGKPEVQKQLPTKQNRSKIPSEALQKPKKDAFDKSKHVKWEPVDQDSKRDSSAKKSDRSLTRDSLFADVEDFVVNERSSNASAQLQSAAPNMFIPDDLGSKAFEWEFPDSKNLRELELAAMVAAKWWDKTRLRLERKKRESAKAKKVDPRIVGQKNRQIGTEKEVSTSELPISSPIEDEIMVENRSNTALNSAAFDDLAFDDFDKQMNSSSPAKNRNKQVKPIDEKHREGVSKGVSLGNESPSWKRNREAQKHVKHVRNPLTEDDSDQFLNHKFFAD